MEMEGYYQVSTISLLMRSDCCTQQMDGFDITLDGLPCYSSEATDVRVPGGSSWIEVQCHGAGSVIKVSLKGQAVSICGVQAKGYLLGYMVDIHGLPTTQSSTKSDEWASSNPVTSYYPSAMGGDGTCSMTDLNQDPWWSITLPYAMAVTRLALLTRKDHFDFLEAFTVMMDGVACAVDVPTIGAGEWVFATCGGYGKNLKIIRYTPGIISVCGLVVFSSTKPLPAPSPPLPPPFTGGYLDLSAAPTAQSPSPKSSDSQVVVSSPNPSPIFSDGTCTKTKGGSPWWEVTLPNSFTLKHVEVLPRGDCCWNAFNGFDVSVDGVPCATNQQIAGGGLWTTVACPATGSVVRISNDNGKAMNLCGVKVMAA
jgi:hypothetical protein